MWTGTKQKWEVRPMTSEAISYNLRRFRASKGLTQQQLAAAAGISRPAYRKIETGQSEPRVSTLQNIAHALDIKLQDLVTPTPQLKSIRFRSVKKMKSREQVIADVSRWLADFNYLEDALNERIPYFFASIKKQRGRPSPEKLAAKVREDLSFDDSEPIRDICGLLESKGIKVYPIRVASDQFFGLSVAADGGGPAVIVNTWERISVERWIFSAAHELGHLLMHLNEYDVTETAENEKEEAEANRFAGAFLMPQTLFEREWNYTYGLSFIDRVMKVKRIFKVSYSAVLYRLTQERRYGPEIWAKFKSEYKRRTGKSLGKADEPSPISANDFKATYPESRSAMEPERLAAADFIEDRLARLVRAAIEKDKITLSRGAEILRLDYEAMRERAAAWV